MRNVMLFSPAPFKGMGENPHSINRSAGLPKSVNWFFNPGFNNNTDLQILEKTTAYLRSSLKIPLIKYEESLSETLNV